MKTIIYVRCSTNHQELEHQISSCKNYADTLGLKIGDVITDFNVSAYSTSYLAREGLQQVLTLAEDGQISNLVVFESSRLSRGGTLEGSMIIDRLTRCNVKVYSVTEGCLNENELSELLNSIRFFQNKLESKKTSERIKSSMNKRREHGYHLGGHTPFGYIKQGNKLAIDNELKPIIIKMFNIYINEGMSKTIEFFKEQGYSKSDRTIMNMLKNKTYCGYLYKNNDKYIKELDIIGLETFLECQKCIANRYTQNHKTVYHNKSDVLLEGLCFHSCGHKMYIVRNKQGVTSYRCEQCIKNRIDTQKSFSANKVEAIVDTYVKQFFSTLNKEELRKQYEESCNNQLDYNKTQLERINKIIAIKDKTIENGNQKLQELLLQNASVQMLEIITDSINQVKSDQETLVVTRDKLINDIANQKHLQNEKIKLSEKLLDMKYLYSKANYEQKKQLLHQVLDRVVIHSWNDIEVVFKE